MSKKKSFLPVQQLTKHWHNNSLGRMCHNALLEFQSLFTGQSNLRVLGHELQVCTNIVSNSKIGFLHLPIPLNHINPHFGTKGSLQCNMYKLLIFNEIKSFMKLHNECTITKFTFLIHRHDIITFNIANYIIHISNFSTK